MKLDQNVCLDEITDEYENRSCQIKIKVTRSNLRKNLCGLVATFLSDMYETWSECLP